VGFVFQTPAMFPGTIAMLEGGRLVEAGPTERLFTAPASGRTRAYLATAD
jgi:ABC-type phosphate transport system ATPase subunit